MEPYNIKKSGTDGHQKTNTQIRIDVNINLTHPFRNSENIKANLPVPI